MPERCQPLFLPKLLPEPKQVFNVLPDRLTRPLCSQRNRDLADLIRRDRESVCDHHVKIELRSAGVDYAKHEERIEWP